MSVLIILKVIRIKKGLSQGGKMASNDVIGLPDRQHVRSRYGMYVGDVSNTTIAFQEIMDNSIDEVLLGNANAIWAYTHKQGKMCRYTITDNGGGIPIKATTDLSSKEITMAEFAVGSLRAGSKFNKTEVQAGTNGVGSSCFVGDTFVSVNLDGCDCDMQIKTIADMISNGKTKLYTYCKDNSGELVLTEILKCWKTKTTTRLVKLTFTRGESWCSEEIVCTPEHLWKTKTGYIRADEITEKTELDLDHICERKPKFVSSIGVYLCDNHGEDVYDLMVANEAHNFQLTGGLLVHNCINFLSEEFSVYSRLETQDIKKSTAKIKKLYAELSDVKKSDMKNWYYKVTFHQGEKAFEKLVDIRQDSLSKIHPSIVKNLPSTITTFLPDPTIWKSQLANSLLTTQYLKYMCGVEGREVHFYLNDEESTEVPKSYKHSFKCRIKNPESETKNDFMEFFVSLGISDKLEDANREYSVNTLPTQQGHHVKLFEKAYTRAFENVFGDCRGYATMGLNSLCIFTCPEPAFASQTKERLSDIPGFSTNREYPELIAEITKVIKANKPEFQANYLRIVEYMKSKENWSRLSEIKELVKVAGENGSHKSSFAPKKLKDCTSKDRKNCELLICEGASASGSLTKARAGMNNIAILPLRGRPLNVSGKDISEVLKNDEMYDLINAIGVGVNEYHSLEEVRYGKIIIAADADSDGMAITNLILGAILEHMTFLIEAGMVYIARCPLYGQGDNYYYYGDESKIDFSKPTKRWKGLGEFNADELKRVTLDPKTRNLVKVTLDNVEYCKKLLSSTPARKELMLKRGVITEGNL